MAVWEKSVLATHHFLAPNDFEEMNELVNDINFNVLEVFCLTKDNSVAGFTGVADKTLEMLF